MLNSLSLMCRSCSVSLFKVVHQAVAVQWELMAVPVEFQEQWWKIDSRPSMPNLRSFIKDNLNGLFQTASCASLWGWLLLKFSCLHIGHFKSVLGMVFILGTCFLLFSLRLLIITFQKNPSFLSFTHSTKIYCFACYRPMVENGKNPQKYIRYSPEVLDRMMNEFFEGKTWNEQKR